MNVKTRSWDEIRSSFEDCASVGIPVQSVLLLLDWIRDQKLEPDLFAASHQIQTEQLADISHTTLILSDQEDFKHGENMLVITQRGTCKEPKIHFTHVKHSGSKEKINKMVPEKDAVETLRLILAYKFGIHRSPAKAEPVSANSELSAQHS